MFASIMFFMYTVHSPNFYLQIYTYKMNAKITFCTLAKMNSFNFIVLSFFVLGIQGDCPDGYFHAGNSCYLTSMDHMSQAAAQEVSLSKLLALFATYRFRF